MNMAEKKCCFSTLLKTFSYLQKFSKSVKKIKYFQKVKIFVGLGNFKVFFYLKHNT